MSAAVDQGQTAAQPPEPAKPQTTQKVPKETQPAPDEPVDVNAPDPGRGVRFTWKQHPSLRVGSVFRLDFQVKLQEDGRWSYDGARELDPWELHRSRVGIQGHLFKRIEYQVERELNEKELTDKDIELGFTRDLALEGRLRQPRLCGQRADPGRQVQDSLRPRPADGGHAERFRIPLARRDLSGALARHRRHGARPVLQARPELLGRRLQARRRQREVEEDSGRRPHVRRPRVRHAVPARDLLAARRDGDRHGVHGQQAVGRFVPAQRAPRPHRDDAGHVLRAGVRQGPAAPLGSGRRLGRGPGVGARGVHHGERRSRSSRASATRT